MTEIEFAYAPQEVSPPGDTLRDLLEERNLSQAELSRRMGRPPAAINEIVSGKKEITEETALELERVLQVPAQFWLARESRYRESLARARELEGRSHHMDWLDSFPIKELQAQGKLTAGRLTAALKTQLVDELLRFFGVASPDACAAQYNSLQAAFRRARPDKQTNTAAITAWLRMGEVAAAQVATAAYSAEALTAALPAMRALTVCDAAQIATQLQKLTAQAGVVLVFVPALSGTHVSGVARWLNDRPLIQLSLLGKWNDGFWFSFFHEVAHILKHPKRAVFLDDAASGAAVETPEEQEANQFSAELLIPPAHKMDMQTLRLERADVLAFAKKLGIHPGIVVGQLQHRGRLSFAHPLTKLKARYEIKQP
jgi:HTH-type transcriptional regulator / antitoxin HigA